MERFHSIQIRAEDAAEVALAIARLFRTKGWKVVRDPKGRGGPTPSGLDPEGLRRFLISPSDRGWVTILPSGFAESGPDSLVAFLARELDTIALWIERVDAATEGAETVTYEVYWKNKRIDRQDAPLLEGKLPSTYPTLIDNDLSALGQFMPAGTKHPKLTVAELPRFYPKYAGDRAFLGRFKKLVTSADYPMLWGAYRMAWEPPTPESERLESWGHLGFQKEDGRSAAARLTHGDPAARRGAVEALASCSVDEARPGLQAALADDDAEVRLAAAQVLATRPDKGLAQDLTDRLADEDSRVKVAAARALKDMGVPQAAPALAEVAGEEDVEVRRAAVAALASIDLPEARKTLVSAGRKDKDPEVRRWAAEGLGRGPFGEVANELTRLLADKDPQVRAAAARSTVRAGARPEKLPKPLVLQLRKVAIKDSLDSTRAVAVRALKALLPADLEAHDLAMKLYAAEARHGDLSELAERLPREKPFELKDKRIVAALLKRLEKEPAAEVIFALANQAPDLKVAEALRGLVTRLWAAPAPKTPARPGGAEGLSLALLREARAAVPAAIARFNDPGAIPLLLKLLDQERVRKAPDEPQAALADEPWRQATCFAAMEAVLELLPRAKPADVEKLKERLDAWIVPGVEVLDAGQAVLRRTALLAYGEPTRRPPAPVAPAAPVKPAPAPARSAGGKKGSLPAAKAPVAPAPALLPPALPNKVVIGTVRPMLHDPRWPEAAMVFARQLGAKAAAPLVSALSRSIDKEVRLARKGGYSKREAESVAGHRRGLVHALRELKDPTSVPVMVRLLTLEEKRAGKVERRTETSLLGVVVSSLQSVTGYKLGLDPVRWQEVAAGKVPAGEGQPARKPAAAKAAPVAKVPSPKVNGKAAVAAKKKPVLVAKKKPAAKRPAPRAKSGKKTKRPLRNAAKVLRRAARKMVRAAFGARRLSVPRRMAAKAARRR